MTDIIGTSLEPDAQVATDASETSPEGALRNAEPAEEGEQESPKYMTQDDFERLWQEREGNIIQRASQSATDRVSARVDERFKVLEENQAALGLSDVHQAQAMESAYREEITRRPGAEATAPPDVQGNQPQAGAVNPVDAIVTAAFQVVGVEVTPQDPEGKAIDSALKNPNMTPEKFQAVVLKASMEKKQRLASTKDKSRLQQPTGGGGQKVDKNDISKITDSDKLYEIAGSEFG